jgi:AraC family transcriptional regulator
MPKDLSLDIDHPEPAAGSFVFYRCGRMPPHEHPSAYLTFLLAGGFTETIDGNEYRVAEPAIGWKPAGTRHSDEWDRCGAFFLSFRLNEGAVARGSGPGWFNLPDRQHLGFLAKWAVAGATPALRSDAICDLVALANGPVELKKGAPPSWLGRAAEMLKVSPGQSSIASLARDSGVTRIHLARTFRRYFGIPPSVYRRRCLAAAAVQEILTSSHPLAKISHDVGFADQSHAARVLRREVGFSASALRALERQGLVSVVPAGASSG